MTYQLKTAELHYGVSRCPISLDPIFQSLESIDSLDERRLQDDLQLRSGGFRPKDLQVIFAPEMRSGDFHIPEQIVATCSGFYVVWQKVD